MVPWLYIFPTAHPDPTERASLWEEAASGERGGRRFGSRSYGSLKVCGLCGPITPLNPAAGSGRRG